MILARVLPAVCVSVLMTTGFLEITIRVLNTNQILNRHLNRMTKLG